MTQITMSSLSISLYANCWGCCSNVMVGDWLQISCWLVIGWWLHTDCWLVADLVVVDYEITLVQHKPTERQSRDGITEAVNPSNCLLQTLLVILSSPSYWFCVETDYKCMQVAKKKTAKTDFEIRLIVFFMRRYCTLNLSRR